MRTNPAIVSFTPLTVHAENLESRGEAIFDQPAIHLLAGLLTMQAPMGGPIVFDVVDAQKCSLGFTTAITPVPAICHVNDMADSIARRLTFEVRFLAKLIKLGARHF